MDRELTFGMHASDVPWVLACLCSAKRPWASDAGCRFGRIEFWNSLVVGRKSEGVEWVNSVCPPSRARRLFLASRFEVSDTLKRSLNWISMVVERIS